MSVEKLIYVNINDHFLSYKKYIFVADYTIHYLKWDLLIDTIKLVREP